MKKNYVDCEKPSLKYLYEHLWDLCKAHIEGRLTCKQFAENFETFFKRGE